MQGQAPGRGSNPLRVPPDKKLSGGLRGAAPPSALQARGDDVRRAPMPSVGAPRPLDTLAQLDQRPGTDDKRKLLNRARAKYLTFPIAIGLAETAVAAGERSYRNAVYCAAELEQDEHGKIRGHYCQTRWCLVCNRIRLARAINRYLPAISAWKDRQFVTLTLPNVQGADLADTIDAMLRDAVNIGRAIKRSDRLPFRALRKLESTSNTHRDDYPPHFHFVVEGIGAADALVARWLAVHPEASAAAQDVRPCDDASMMELFKYFTKIIVKRPDDSGSRMIAPFEALDMIFLAMRGHRVYQPVGFKVAVDFVTDENGKVGVAGDTAAVKRLGEQVQWQWLQQVHDWVDLSSGDTLTGYEPTDRFRSILRTASEGRSDRRPVPRSLP